MKKKILVLLALILIGCPIMTDLSYSDERAHLLDQTKSRDDDDREDAAEKLRAYPSAETVSALIRLLSDKEEDVVKKAAESLGSIRNPRAVDPLIRLLHNSDSGIKGAAVKALGDIGDSRAILALERLVASEWNPFLKISASQAIDRCHTYTGVYQETIVEQHTEPIPESAITHPAPQPQTIVPNTSKEPLHKIAVLSFRDTASAGTTTGFGDAISEMMTTAFIKSNYFEVIERAQIKKIMEEQNFNLSGSVDSDTAIELGKLLGVKYLVVGSVARLGSLFETDIRFIDTKTGKGILAESGNSHGEEHIRPMVNDITNRIINKYNSLQ